MLPKRICKTLIGKSRVAIFFVVTIALITVFLVLSFLVLPKYFPTVYIFEKKSSLDVTDNFLINNHVKTPKAVKAVYMTANVAGIAKLRDKVIKLIDDTELNAVVIDVKDYTGDIAFTVKNPILKKYEDSRKKPRVKDIDEFISTLHKKGIYVIGRVSAFQDLNLTKLRPDLAVRKKSNVAEVWRDRKGISWLDPNSKEVWSYVVSVGKEAYVRGFDEINFDYIRFPSDGNMEDIFYKFSTGEEKKETLRKFFGFVRKEFRGTNAILSADLFGMTTTNTDDLNIGQYLEFALPYFDYVAPMVYPSHYPLKWNGYKDPEAYPYEVVNYSMKKAFLRASTTPQKLRPWLQDFGLRMDYDAKMVKAQISAVYDSGLTSWMLWNPSNRYTREALEGE
jgi:hypothetical protein